MSLQTLVNKFKRGAVDNSSEILTAVGVIGTVTTAYLASKATLRADGLIQKDILEEGYREENDNWKYKLKLVWRVYIPTVGSGAVTIASIIWANRLGAKKVAALAAAYGISERAFQEYKEKVLEKFGENKARAVRDELAQKKIDEHPITKEVIITGTGDVLFFDILSGRYFNSSVEEVRRVENNVNAFILQHMYASLSTLYDELGLQANGFSDTVGFNTDNLVEIVFSTTMSNDGRPCITIDFHNQPIAFYHNLY